MVILVRENVLEHAPKHVLAHQLQADARDVVHRAQVDAVDQVLVRDVQLVATIVLRDAQRLAETTVLTVVIIAVPLHAVTIAPVIVKMVAAIIAVIALITHQITIYLKLQVPLMGMIMLT